MYDIDLVPHTYAELDTLGKPENPSDPEYFPHWLFDTQTYVSGAAGTIHLPFFQAVQVDPTLGNVPNQAQLPAREYFVPQYLMFDPLLNLGAAAATNVGMASDIQQLTMSGRGIWTFTIKSKMYGPYPLSLLHGSGGVAGVALSGTWAAPLMIQAGQNGIFDGGVCIKGFPVIPPSTRFTFSLDWPAPLTLAAGNSLVRVIIAGTYYRPLQ